MYIKNNFTNIHFTKGSSVLLPNNTLTNISSYIYYTYLNVANCTSQAKIARDKIISSE